MEETNKNDKNVYKPVIAKLLCATSIISFIIVISFNDRMPNVAFPLSVTLFGFIIQTVALLFEDYNLPWKEMGTAKKFHIIGHVVSMVSITVAFLMLLGWQPGFI